MLAKLGGANIRALLYAMMSRLLSKELALQYSFLGRKGKKKFATLQLSEVVFCE
jgi:hypothetical protein